MPRTADSIEEAKSQTADSEQSPKQSPRSRVEPLIKFWWKKGQSGNPGGRPKRDFAAEFARKVLEAQDNEHLLAQYAAGFAKQLTKGNAYTFKELAVRGYGNIVEKKEVKHFYEETPDADLSKRIADLERDLGLARAIDEAGRAGIAQARTEPTNGKAKDTPVLP